MNGGPSIWAISPEERNKHDQKFDTLSPSMGYVSGEQARKFFLQSGLPASVLAEIWALADMNKDGKMDRLEFSIAMKLIKLKLQGTSLPSALPIIMKQPPVRAPSLSNPTSSLTNPAYGMGTLPNMSMMHGTNLAMLTPISMATPGLSPLTPMTGMGPLIVSTPSRPLMPTMGNATLPNGTMGILQAMPAGTLATGLPFSASSYSSPLGLTTGGMNKASSLLDLGSISSASSSPSVMSPMVSGPSDWAVPHASRLKYRQQFNGLDKQMIGYLTGQQVRGAMATTMLTQTQLASIWNLADVDKDGKLKAEEFILAMHLVDVAKCGQPLPLTLPTELVPPSQRSAMNGSSPSPALTNDLDIEPPQKAKPNYSFEDKFKANLERGNAELEKRRQALLDAERREQEWRAQKELWQLELKDISVGEMKELISKAGSRKSAGASGGAAGVTPKADHRCTEQHFVDKYRAQLIQRVRNIDPILDQLLSKKVIHQESYDVIRALQPSQRQMRELYRCSLDVASAPKDIFYKILKKENKPLIEDLEENESDEGIDF